MSAAHAGVIADFGVLVVAVALGFVLARRDARWERFSERTQAALAHPLLGSGLGIFMAFLIASFVAAAVSRFTWLEPGVQGEFAHLLVSDTLAAGRLANATPAYWEFFETFGVVVQPFYAAAVPPGQGAWLAASQAAAHPSLGVWLGHGVAAAACCWALRAVTPGGTAFLGAIGLATAARTLHAWGLSYMPGSLSVAAGALVFGGALRAAKDAQFRSGLIAGLGAAVLILTVSWQGASVLLGVLVFSPRSVRWCVRFLAPVALFAVVGVALHGAYNRSITGNPWKSPDAVYREQYDSTSRVAFVEPELPPLFLHREMREHHDLGVRTALAKLDAPLMALVNELWACVRFLIGITLIAPLASCWRRKRETPLRVAAGVVCAGTLGSV